MDGCKVTFALECFFRHHHHHCPCVQFYSQWLAIYDHFHLKRLPSLSIELIWYREYSLRHLPESWPPSCTTRTEPSVFADHSSVFELVTLTSATSWFLTMTNIFDVTHFAGIITLGCAEWTLGGSVAVLATPKTTIASLSAHFMDFFCLETSTGLATMLSDMSTISISLTFLAAASNPFATSRAFSKVSPDSASK